MNTIYENQSVEVENEIIYFDVEKKKIKNMYLKVKKDKKIIVEIPIRMSLNIAKEFVKNKVKWIKKQQELCDMREKKKEKLEFKNGETIYLLGKKYKLELIEQKNNYVEIDKENIKIYIKEKYINDENYIEKFYEKWLKTYALNIFKTLTIQYQAMLQKYNIKVPKIEVRQMKSRWGSCIPAYNKVVFNLQLIQAPVCCIEYVVLHELSHFKYQNHSKNFYNFIEGFMPDWKERKRILNNQ